MRKWRNLSLGAALLALVLVGVQAWRTYPGHGAHTKIPVPPTHSRHASTVQGPNKSAPIAALPPAHLLPDQVELGAENIDRLHAEHTDLASRKQDLDSQLADSEALLKLKAQRIEQLQKQLQQGSSRAP